MVLHSNKSNPSSSRGGGAWESNTRLTFTLVKMDKNHASMFGMTTREAQQKGFMMTASDNYGGQNVAYFIKDAKTDLPHPVSPDHNSAELVQEWLLEILTEHGPVNRRNLQQTRSKDDNVVAAMLDSYPDVRGNKQELIAAAIDALLEDDRIFEFKDGKAVMLTAKRPWLKLSQDGGDGTDDE